MDWDNTAMESAGLLSIGGSQAYYYYYYYYYYFY